MGTLRRAASLLRGATILHQTLQNRLKGLRSDADPGAKAAHGSINPAPISTVLNVPSNRLSAAANAAPSAVRLRLISSQRGHQLPVI